MFYFFSLNAFVVFGLFLFVVVVVVVVVYYT
jgi:hypothetical protein